MGYTRIVGTGAYLPAKTLTNQEIEQRIETKQAKQSAAGAGATDEDAEDAEVARGDDTFR